MIKLVSEALKIIKVVCSIDEDMVFHMNYGEIIIIIIIL